MQFVNDPVKSRGVFILMLILTILFFLASGTLGYFYYREFQRNKTLESDKKAVENQLENASQSLQKQITALEKGKTELENENKTLEDQAFANKVKVDKIKAYTTCLAYLTSLVKTHSGLDGWTDAEFQKGRTLAQATGDQNFLDTVDWAWNRTDIDQITRLAGFFGCFS